VSGSDGPDEAASMPAADGLVIRTASAADAELLWEWANDPDTRRWSFHAAPIPWATHVAWLDSRLADPATRIYVVSADGAPRAVVRYEAGGSDVAVVSIVVDPAERGRGWGTRALRLACPTAARELAAKRIDAYIKPDNRASISAFERAGFALSVDEGDADALRMVWHPGSP
jgi:RimJ/RimL family protein N-acetyltransferase